MEALEPDATTLVNAFSASTLALQSPISKLATLTSLLKLNLWNVMNNRISTNADVQPDSSHFPTVRTAVLMISLFTRMKLKSMKTTSKDFGATITTIRSEGTES